MMKVYKVSGGDISVWAEEGGPVMLKITTTYNDPVELNEDEVDELISILKILRKEIS